MEMETKTHIFFQTNHEEPKRFSFGANGAEYSESEVQTIIKMLPPNDNVIRIVWAEYPLWHPGHPKYRETKLPITDYGKSNN